MNFIKRMFGAKAQYIMMAEDTRASSKRLGVQSIILAIVGLCVVTVGVVAGSLLAHELSLAASAEEYSFPIFTFIGVILCYCIALAAFLSCSLSSISFAVYQRKANKLAIGKAALGVSLACLFACIIITIVLCIVLI